ncbi:MAG: hypothetical protein A2X86_21235 [Bdellovibrionales bacterium GWA2_49_15]|nr:MAG: hypothetical protein A2X86_21235 [Bdellovibrionales bacterium GWA2_49_15]HAZ14903.1 hypothetical protein [Bdellovibrionales bacterium]
MRPELMLDTPRLTLRSWTLEDRPLMQLLPLDEGLNTFCVPGTYAYQNEKDLDDKLAQRISLYQEKGLGKFIIELKETKEFVGLCGVGSYELKGKNIHELAYRLRRPYWGQGLGTEVSRAMLQYAFEELEFSEVYAFADPQNAASLNIIKKLGFTFHGKIMYADVPHHVFVLLKKDWKA